MQFGSERLKPAQETTLTDYDQNFIFELNRLKRLNNKSTDLANQLRVCLENHIPKMAHLIQSEFTTKGTVPSQLLKCFDWACYRAIAGFSGSSQEDIDKQRYYIQMSIDYAFAVKNDYYIAEAFTNKLYLCLDRKDSWGLRDAVCALREANSKLSYIERQKFEQHIIKSIRDKLYEQEKEEALLMDGLDNIAFDGVQNKPRLTLFEIEQQRALKRNLFKPNSDDTLDDLLNLFERKCALH